MTRPTKLAVAAGAAVAIGVGALLLRGGSSVGERGAAAGPAATAPAAPRPLTLAPGVAEKNPVRVARAAKSNSL